MRTKLTPAERRLVERYVGVLDCMALFPRTADEGQLKSSVDALIEELERADGSHQVRLEVVAVAVLRERYEAYLDGLFDDEEDAGPW